MRALLLAPGLLLALAASAASAQEPPPAAPEEQAAQSSRGSCAQPRLLPTHAAGRTIEELARMAEITGRSPLRLRAVRRGSDEPIRVVCGSLPWASALSEVPAAPLDGVRLLPVRSGAVLNTGYPVDRNDGLLRPGVGVSALLAAGLEGHWGPFSAAAAPELAYQANGEFVVSPLGRNGLDWPQRVGTADYAVLDPGQSYARVDAYGVAAGVSTENLWLGPGREGSILLSGTGPGIPHAFLGMTRARDIGLGRLDAEVFWGRLGESALFDEDGDNDHRLLTGVSVALEPRGAPGLMLGVARLIQRYIPPEGLELGDYIPSLSPTLKTGEEAAADGSDEFLAFYLHWVLPESGFEVYGEWAKYDGNADFHDALVEPENGRAYALGLQKVFEVGQRWLRLHGEVANLNPTLIILHRNTSGGIYRHSVIRQGHTHRGQLLGSWTGPGSDYQTLGGDLLSGWGSAGLFAERVRRNVDVYFATEGLRQGYPLRHDVELTVGTRAVYLWRDLEATGSVAYSHRRNRDFLPLDADELDQGYRVDSNWNLQLGLRWRPNLDRRTLVTRPAGTSSR